ncbi:NAD(P)-dependent oxidoreductase [Candidatus Gottesmanbacteria bacterium]|nr:NAD(P)-dependent oxidoreductase [Candidatus Gottesmanbacteria bacterium]
MNNKRVLITGGEGFLGSYLVQYLSRIGGYDVVIFDKLDRDGTKKYPKTASFCKGNILSQSDIHACFDRYGPFAIVFHLASAMPNKADSDEMIWKTNVEGTKFLAAESARTGVKSFIFTSSNVTYGVPRDLPVTENTHTLPVETYGKSKKQAEEELEKYKNRMNIQIFRCPVISGIGRLGLQAILFEFISENRNVYVLGDGLNKYQFVDAGDVCTALEKAASISGFDIYTIGGDGVMTLRELYQSVIAYAKSSSKIISLPKFPALVALAILDRLNVSPLGVYQYSMIGQSMYADTTKIKKKLRWKPRKTNIDSFVENYEWYIQHKKEFTKIGSSNISANRSLPKMGIFTLLKKLS